MKVARRRLSFPFATLALWLTAIPAITLLMACAGADDPRVTTTGRHLPPPPGSASAAAPAATALATVGGARITEQELAAQMALAPAETRTDDMLRSLIELEVVAQAAADAGYWSPEVLGKVWRRMLVKRFLKDRFERGYDDSQIPDADLERIWQMKGIRMQFDHYDVYEVADLQFVCCASHFSQCDQGKTRACIDENMDLMTDIWQRHLKDRELNQHALRYLGEEELVGELGGVRGRVPDAGERFKVMTYSFYFDPSKPYEEQKGYTVFNANVVAAVVATPVGETSPPIASNNGIHLLYVMSHKPGKHLDLEDKLVQDHIRGKVLPGYRQRDAAILIDSLMSQHGVKIDEEGLQALRLNLRVE